MKRAKLWAIVVSYRTLHALQGTVAMPPGSPHAWARASEQGNYKAAQLYGG